MRRIWTGKSGSERAFAPTLYSTSRSAFDTDESHPLCPPYAATRGKLSCETSTNHAYIMYCIIHTPSDKLSDSHSHTGRPFVYCPHFRFTCRALCTMSLCSVCLQCMKGRLIWRKKPVRCISMISLLLR